MEQDMVKYRKMFLLEALELLEQANEDILKIETGMNDELVNAIFRNIHTIKGSAAGLGFDEITEFSHAFEAVLDRLRKGELTVESDLVDAMLEANDGLVEMVLAAQEERPHTVSKSVVTESLERYVSQKSDAPVAPVTEERTVELVSAPRDVLALLEPHSGGGMHLLRVDVAFTDEMLENGYDPLPLLKNLRESSACCVVRTENTVPALDSYLPLNLYLKPEVYLATALTPKEVEDFAFDDDLISVKYVSLSAETAPVESVTEAVSAVPEGVVDCNLPQDMDKSLFTEFAASVAEYFEDIEPMIIEIEKGNVETAADVNVLFRIFHNIKGDAGYVGFSIIEKYAHAVESLLDKMRNGSVTFDRKAAEIVLTVISDLKRIISECSLGNTVEIPPMYHEVNRIVAHLDTVMDAPRDVASNEINIFLAQVDQFLEIIDLAMGGETVEPQHITRAVKDLGNAARFLHFNDLVEIADSCIDQMNSGKPFENNIHEIRQYINRFRNPVSRIGDLLVSDGLVTPEQLDDAAKSQKKIGEILVEKGVLPPEKLDTALKKQKVMEAVSRREQTAPVKMAEAEMKMMKVDQVKIDQFTNTIGELVVAKNAYEYMVQKIARDYNLPTEVVKDLRDNSYLISRISQDLQRDIMSLRMIPIKQIFSKFPRVVRDIARKQGKSIELRILGEDTEIDKKVADELSDPLVHMIRNACDHGIEFPQVREAAGKIPTGHIIMKAYQEGSFVFIEIIDDGKGIDADVILKKATERGLLTGKENLRKNEILGLIFEPGFSTAQTVTDVSGRGVGMDVVKTTITGLGGSVDVYSDKGDGTRVVLKIPVTIGVSTALLIESSSSLYAFPIENIMETINVPRSEIQDLHYGSGIAYRNTVLPVFSLNDILGEPPKNTNEEINVVIIKTEAGKAGIIVDRLLNRMDIAIKPVPEYFSDLPYIGGVSILGDGQAVLVLNPGKLL